MNSSENIKGTLLSHFEPEEIEEWTDPYNSIPLKLLTIIIYLFEIAASMVMLTFVSYETKGLFGHYRTVINQLLSYAYAAGALYGIVVCGITSIRIWFGPLPLEVCHFQTWVKKFVSWYVLFSLLYISLAKFMYICVWKHMRDMNDDLIVAFLVRIAVFISVWVPTTGFNNRKGQSSVVSMCTGVFNDHDQIMNSEFRSDKLPQPYNPIFWSLCVTILCLMAAVMIGRQRNSHKNTNLPIMQKPKDLESMLLNFSLLILLLINMFGYNFYWRGLSPNQMALYPNWLIVYVIRIIVPMLMLTIVAFKILLKSRKEIKRAYYIKDVVTPLTNFISVI